jgi:chromosome segregation ATPase
MEPVGSKHEVGEPSVVRCRSNPGSWAWYPDMVRGWIREERVPSFELLPRLLNPLEQAFAAVVAKMDRTMRETTGAITSLFQRGDAIEAGLDRIRGDLTETDQLHNNLVVEVRGLANRLATTEQRLVVAQARATTTAHGLELALARIAELEAQLAGEEEEEEPEEEPEEVPEADEAEGEGEGGEVVD